VKLFLGDFNILIYISAQMELRPVSMFELFFGVLFSDLIPTMLYLPACSLVVFLVQKAIKYSLISTSIDIGLAFNEQPLSILEYSLWLQYTLRRFSHCLLYGIAIVNQRPNLIMSVNN
jgi:hypothetical protein